MVHSPFSFTKVARSTSLFVKLLYPEIQQALILLFYAAQIDKFTTAHQSECKIT